MCQTSMSGDMPAYGVSSEFLYPDSDEKHFHCVFTGLCLTSSIAPTNQKCRKKHVSDRFRAALLAQDTAGCVLLVEIQQVAGVRSFDQNLWKVHACCHDSRFTLLKGVSLFKVPYRSPQESHILESDDGRYNIATYHLLTLPHMMSRDLFAASKLWNLTKQTR